MSLLGIGGMIEGLQILLLGILFQRLHQNNTKLWAKNKFYHFWWLAPENSKNFNFIQKPVKNQKPDGYYEIELKVRY